MANFFDQFDAAPQTGNFFDQFDEKKGKAGRKSTIGSELVRGGKQMLSSVRTGAEALIGSPEEAALAGIERGRGIGEEAGEGASLEAVKRAYQERGLLSAAGEVAGQVPRALAGQVPQLAAMAGAAKLGAMAGTAIAPGPGTIAGGILGAGASLLPQFFGSNVERQAAEQLEKGEPVQIDRTTAGAAAAGQAAIEGAGTAFVLGKRIVKGVLGVADDTALATAKAQQAMTRAAERSLATAALGGSARGIATEIPVEIAQSVIERAQAGLDVTSPEAMAEYGEVAYQAGLVGGAIGGGAGPVDTAMARQGVKARDAFQDAEAKRIAAEERARLEAEAAEKAKIPPLALGMAEPFKPVVFPDGSVATTPEDVARYEEQQFQNRYAAQPGEQPYAPAPSLTGTDLAAQLGQRPGGGGLTDILAGRRMEEENARVEEARRARVVPESDEAGRQVLTSDRSNADMMSIMGERRAIEEQAAAKEAARLARVESQQARRQASLLGEVESPMMAAMRERKAAQEAADAAAENLRQQEEKKAEEAKYALGPKITKTPMPSLLGRQEDAGGDLATMMRTKREEQEAKAEVPLVDNYPFLLDEKRRLEAGPTTQQSKKMIARINERLDSIVVNDLKRAQEEIAAAEKAKKEQERQAASEAKMAKESVFAQESLPEMESRDVIFGNEALADLQAPTLPGQELTREEINARIKEKRATFGKPYKTPEEDRLEQAEMERRKFARSKESKSGTLMDALKGKLSIEAVSDIGGRRGRGYESLIASKGKTGSSLEDLVDAGELDSFLPPDERVGMSNFDSQNASNKLRDMLSADKQTPTFEVQMARRGQDDAIAALESDVAAVKEPAAVQAEVSEIEPGEAASIDRSLGDIRYKRATGKTGLGKKAVQYIVDAVKSRWSNAPEVVVAESMDDPVIPQEVRDHNKAAVAKGAKGSPQGFYYKGKAYIIADSIGSTKDAVEALMHEALGHFGLRGVFGKKMEDVLRDIIKNRRTEVEGKAEQYGLDPKNDADLLEAAEEVLAVMAQTKPGLPFVRRALAVIRNFLRDIGFDIKMSDADIIQKYILPARAFVESGKGRSTEGKPAASREVDIPQFSEDIPNESWLQEKINYAQRLPRNEFGVPKMSSVTGRFKEPVMVPARWLKDAKGQRGEEKNVRQKDLDAIRKIIRDTGKFPLNDDGTEYVPYIEIGYDGKPWVSEGNHRIMAAIAEGMEYIPVELRYFDGGQRRAGVWSPGNVASITERVEQEKPAAMRGESPKTGPGAPAFDRWFGDSKVVDEDGDPLRMYHSTTSDFEAFDTSREALGGAGSWFSVQPSYRPVDGEEGARVMPVYLSLQNPKAFDFAKESADYRKENLVKQGYDGVIITINGELKVAVAFEPTQIKSATGNIGTYDPEIQDIRYSRQNIKGQPVLAQWTTPNDTKLYGETTKDDVIYSLQNKMIDTKRVVDAISTTAGKIMAKWNPYLQEELFHGRTAKQTADFLKKELRPLMQDMSARGVNIQDFEEYLHNRHAEDYNNHVAKINPKMPDGGSGIKTPDARAYMSSLTPKQKADFEALAKRIDAINKNTREVLVAGGLETRDLIDQWEKTFPSYVPLKREELDYAYTAGGMGTGQGFDVRGNFSRRATGSERNVIDILANTAMQRERAIIKAEKNRVAQATFGLAAQNPNPDFWLPIDPMAEVDPAAAQDLLSFGLSQQDLDFLMKEPHQKAVDKSSGQVVERINATLRNNENVMSMRFNGRDRYVFFNPNNPRSARMISALKNLDADQLGPILGNLSKVTRWFAAVNTQYNPIFGAYNFLRDVQGAALQLSDTPLAKDRKAVVAGTLPALKGIYSALRAERDGTAVSGPWAALWNEFQEAGGQTGFRDQFSRSQERAEALEKELKMVTEGKLKSAGRGMLDWLSDYNDSMENAVRLSAYKAALDRGIDKQEAASIAKNLTVNFNRKGQIAVQAGALYAFFNAAVQGTTRLAQTLRGPAGKKIMAGGLLLGTMQAALLAAAGFDDEEPPEFVRERNLILPIGGDKYLTFPMPLGYHVIPSTSRIITEWALSGFKNTPDRIASLTGMYLEAFNPIGNAGWSAQTLAPTFADPIVALTENRDWTGKPIARKDFSSLDPTPGYTRAKDTASEFSTQIAKFLNYASGGTEFKPGVLSPTPDQLDYLIGQVTGGIGREVLKAEQTALKTASGEELPPYKIPVVGRFYGETKSSAAESSRFYKNMTELNEHENEIKGRRASKQPITDYMQENPEARLAPLARKTYSEIQKLRKRKEKLLERDAPRESIKQVEDMITKRMQAFNDRVEAIKE